MIIEQKLNIMEQQFILILFDMIIEQKLNIM